MLRFHNKAYCYLWIFLKLFFIHIILYTLHKYNYKDDRKYMSSNRTYANMAKL